MWQFNIGHICRTQMLPQMQMQTQAKKHTYKKTKYGDSL